MTPAARPARRPIMLARVMRRYYFYAYAMLPLIAAAAADS